MTPLLSVGPLPLTGWPPFATSSHERCLNFVDLSVTTVRPETVNVRFGHRPLTPVAEPEKSARGPEGCGDGAGAGAGAGVGVWPGAGVGVGPGAGVGVGLGVGVGAGAGVGVGAGVGGGGAGAPS